MKIARIIAGNATPIDSAALITKLHTSECVRSWSTGDAPATAAIVAHVVGLDGVGCPPGRSRPCTP